MSAYPKKPPRKWLMDRVSGQSKYNDQERPPAPCCWVPPCVAWCPCLLETNCFCRCFGMMGISANETFRFICLHMGFIANVLAMLATSYACLAISTQYFFLSKSSLGVIEVNDTTGNLLSEPAYIFLGARGVGFNDPSMAGHPLGQYYVVGYDDLCLVAEETSAYYYFDPTQDCAACASDYFSMNAVISFLVAIPLFFPTFFSQQLRMYSGYDVNCVKNSLSITSILIICLNLNVLLTYIIFCGKQSFQSDPTAFFDAQGDVVDSADDAFIALEFTWSWGWAFNALIISMGLKVIDLLCNVAVPTPKVTRDRHEQEIYETIVYVDPEEAEGTDEENNE